MALENKEPIVKAAVAQVIPAATKPRLEAIPISGKEMAQLLLAQLAKDLSKHQQLGEVNAYPGAKVEFALRVSTIPLEEKGVVVFENNYVIDLSNPPDVVRILNDLPVWETAKVVLDRYTQQVEVKAEPSEELKAAAVKVASGGAVKGGRV